MTDSARRYRDARRRVLVDMHIPDWDPAFLSRYEPANLVSAVAGTGAEAAMLYFQSHVGICYYPTLTGKRHRAMGDRDWAGEAVEGFAAHGIPVCAYYSVNFNNQAWLDHPDWRLKPAATATIGVLPRERYGIVCLNNAEYRAFVDAQIAEIAAYPVDAFFFDMVWWNGVCTCPSCAQRLHEETGLALPASVNWGDPEWSLFQRTREGWLSGFAIALRDAARRIRPEADVYHNFALGLSNWTRGVSFSSVAGHDFLGGDFYGGVTEQQLMMRLMLNLSPNRPAEFMTTANPNLTEHTRLRPRAQMEAKALAAAATGSAFLAILPIDPDGQLAPEMLSRTAAAFEASQSLDGLTEGKPIETVALYCSDTSKADVWDEPRALTDAPPSSLPDYPHFAALSGAARALQDAHIPFGVVSRANLAELARWPMLVLPNAERLDDREIAALRGYVENGGCLYASRGTSLWDSAGGRREDFGLADLFGCHFAAIEEGRIVYARAVADIGDPRHLLAHPLAPNDMTGCLRVTASAADATILATLTLPYAHPHKGAVSDQNWASIHSSPPWTRTDHPLVIERKHGQGRVIYSAFDIEAGDSPEHRDLFRALVERMVGDRMIVRADAHPQVALSAFQDTNRITVILLNNPAEHPALPIPGATVRISPPPGHRLGLARDAATGATLAAEPDGDGLIITCNGFSRFAAVCVDMESLANA